MGAKQMKIVFNPRVQVPLENAQYVKISFTLCRDVLLLAHDSEEKWTNSWTLEINKNSSFEYHYVIAERDNSGEKIVKEDKVRKINLTKLKIDNSIINSSITLISTEDIWGSEGKFALTQVPILKEMACVVLGNYLNVEHSLKPETKFRIEKLAKLFNEAPTQYKIAILSGNSQKRMNKFETIAMFEYGLQLGIGEHLMSKDTEAKDTIDNAIFTKVKLTKMGIVQFDIITSKALEKRPEMIFRQVFDDSIFKFNMIDDEFAVTEESIRKNEYLMKGLPEKFEQYGFDRNLLKLVKE